MPPTSPLLVSSSAIGSLGATPAAITTTTETLILAGKIPANDLAVGSTFVVIAFGTASAGTAGSMQGRLRFGTAGSTADAQIAASGVSATFTTALGWEMHGIFNCKTTGASGTVIGNISVRTGTTWVASNQTATVTVNTTVDNFLGLTGANAGTATPSWQTFSTVILR